MKALTVCQPWAWAIVHHTKRIENRSWATSYRGPIAIHAGKSRAHMTRYLSDWTRPPTQKQLVFGAVIGVGYLVDIVPPDDQAVWDNVWAEGPWCWIIGCVRPLKKPVRLRGRQGLFDIDDKLLEDAA